MSYIESAKARLEIAEDHNWSEKVKTKWHPPEGFYKQSAQKIAQGLIRASDSLKQAVSRVSFYRNRAGDNLSQEDSSRLDTVIQLLHKHFDGAAA